MDKKEFDKEIEFIQELRANKVKTPNQFTVSMGQLIRFAREEREMSQAELAKQINRRPATISNIENGKSEIGVLTLVLFAITLDKPISYFFPESLLKNAVADVKTPFEHKVLEYARSIENVGDESLTLDILEALTKNFDEWFDEATR